MIVRDDTKERGRNITTFGKLPRIPCIHAWGVSKGEVKVMAFHGYFDYVVPPIK